MNIFEKSLKSFVIKYLIDYRLYIFYKAFIHHTIITLLHPPAKNPTASLAAFPNPMVYTSLNCMLSAILLVSR